MLPEPIPHEKCGNIEAEIRRLIDQQSFNEACVVAVRGYGPEIFGFLVNVMDDADAAGDVYSQFVEDMLRGLPRFRPLAMFRTWAYRLARNARHRYYRDPYRRRTRRLQTEEGVRLVRETKSEYLACQTSPEELLARVRQKLTPHERELLTLHLDRGMGWEEVAEVVGISHVAARKRFQRIREKIRAILASERASMERRR